MRTRQLLTRIDSHMERGNVLMERGSSLIERGNDLILDVRAALDRNADAFERHAKAFERNAEAFDRNADALERNREVFEQLNQSHGDLRVFIRDISRRNELGHQQVVAELRELRQESRANTESIREQTGWVRAQTDAITRILDRLANGPDAQEA